MKQNQSKILIIGALFIFILIGTFIFIIKPTNNTSDIKDTNTTLPQNKTYPKIENTSEITLQADSQKRQVTLSIDKIPEDINEIEYELSYDAIGESGEKVPQGSIGTISTITNQQVERIIKLGTCSATCTYHKGVENIHVSLKFNGTKGTRMFEKDYPI